VSESRVLFCPFCREHFEGLTHCPTHELLLLPFSELGEPLDADDDDRPLPAYSPGLGRGLLLAGVVLTLLAFLCPLASLSGQVSMSSTLLDMARTRSARLWLVPTAMFAQLLVLHRRRTPAALRGARLSVLLLSLLPSVVVASKLFDIRAVAQLMTTNLRSAVHMHIGVGAWLVWLAALPMLRASATLGVRAARRVRT
jgi:hypothetical protein